MGRARRATKKKQVLKHPQDDKKMRLPELKQTLHYQGLIWDRGLIMENRQMENKVRDALCGDLVKFNPVAVVTRINELLKRLFIYREVLSEPVKSPDTDDEDDEEDEDEDDEEEQVQYTDWDGMSDMSFQTVSWTRRQKELMQEDISSFTYALVSARARAVNNPSLDMALNHKKPAFPFADHIDKLLAFMKDKQSPLLPAGEALDMGHYREPSDHGMLDEEDEEDSEHEQPAGLAEATYDADEDVDMMDTKESADVAIAKQAMGHLELDG